MSKKNVNTAENALGLIGIAVKCWKRIGLDRTLRRLISGRREQL